MVKYRIPLKNDFYKIKKSIFQPNYATYEKMLRKKFIRFKKIYKFYFDYFFIKRTVFVLIVKNVIKYQKFNFPDKLRHMKKMFRKKIVRFKKIYKFYFDHFLIKCTVFVIRVINNIKNQKI